MFTGDEQECVIVMKMFGNGRLEPMYFDGVKKLCYIKKLSKRFHKNIRNFIGWFTRLPEKQSGFNFIIQLSEYAKISENDKDNDKFSLMTMKMIMTLIISKMNTTF